MNVKDNGSNFAEETRSIQRIIYEKAVFGAVPIEFQTDDGRESNWHPVDWPKHPQLCAVRFSDGSVQHIHQPKRQRDDWYRQQRVGEDGMTPKDVQHEASLEDMAGELGDMATSDAARQRVEQAYKSNIDEEAEKETESQETANGNGEKPLHDYAADLKRLAEGVANAQPKENNT